MSTLPVPASSGDLTVASKETSVYEGGQLIVIKVEDLMTSEVAVRQLVNNMNVVNQRNEGLEREVAQLREERAASVLHPALSAFIAFVAICGTVLVGLAVNYLSSQSPPSASGLLLFIGCVLVFLSAAAPPLAPFLNKHIVAKRNANR